MWIEDHVLSSSISLHQDLGHPLLLSPLNEVAPLRKESGNCDPTLCLSNPELPAHRSAVSSPCGPVGSQARPSDICTSARADGASLHRPASVSLSGPAGAVPATVTKPEKYREDDDQRRGRKTEVKYRCGKHTQKDCWMIFKFLLCP